MIAKESDSRSREIRGSLNRRILRSTTLNILLLVIICCAIMAYSMQSLANSILLDSLQPMARQAAKTVEANIHMLADRMMTIAADGRLYPSADTEGGETEGEADARSGREEVLTQAFEIYEFYTIALYDMQGELLQGVGDAPESLEENFFGLLKETDNLTTAPYTVFQERSGIIMGMPVKAQGETALYVAGVYKYDTLNDVISGINLGKHGMAYMVNREGIVTGHPDESQVLQGSTLAELNEGDEETLSRVTTGETGATEFPVEGEDMLVAFSPIRGTQWSLVIQVPKSDYHPLISEALMMALWVTLAVLAISILLVLHLSRPISRPVKTVTSRMVALSDGDLHTQVEPVRSGDELEVMTRTLETTVKTVNGYISDIQQVLTRMAEGDLCVEPQKGYKGDFALIRASLMTILQSMRGTIAGFSSAASRLADMADELNGQSGQLHQASVEQNQSTQALVHEVSNVKDRLLSVTESSGQTRAGMEEIVRCVQQANIRMASLSGAMDDISANAREITQIARVIGDIAFQTNILALNASVEAARAGSAGEGFAVVAQEVRELASRSAKAASNAAEIVNSTTDIIQTGVELTADTAGSLRDISTVSDQIGAITDQLVAAVQGQQSALTIMEERIENISTIADRNLQNAMGTEQSSGLLAKEAESLRVQVKEFVLKEDGDR